MLARTLLSAPGDGVVNGDDDEPESRDICCSFFLFCSALFVNFALLFALLSMHNVKCDMIQFEFEDRSTTMSTRKSTQKSVKSGSTAGAAASVRSTAASARRTVAAVAAAVVDEASNAKVAVAATTPAAAATTTTTTFTIVTGSYEHMMVGLSVTRSALDDAVRESLRHVSSGDVDAVGVMPTIFARAVHTASIRTVAASAKFFVTGSADETMQVFHTRKRRELGVLTHHSGAINALALHGTHALSASDDGTIAVWRTGREWKLHAILGKKGKAPIVDIAVHPSGRALLSIGKDRRLAMWNLVTAQLIYKQKHAAECQRVLWSPTGKHYALVQGKSTLLFTDENVLVHTLDAELAVHTAAFSPDGAKLAIGGEDKQVTLFGVANGKKLWTGAHHQRRVKDLRFLDADFIVSVCSLGDVRIWHVPSGRCVLTRKLDCRLNTVAAAALVDGAANDDDDIGSDDGGNGDDDDDDDDDDNDDDENAYDDDGDGDGDDEDDEGDVIVAEGTYDDDDAVAGNDDDDDDDEDDDVEFAKAVASNFKGYERLAVEKVDTGLTREVEDDPRTVKRLARQADGAKKKAKIERAPKND
jgi:protein MAK11